MVTPVWFTAVTGANALLVGETQGFAIDATTAGGTVSVIDTTTPANNKSNVALNSSNLAQNGASSKVVLWNDGLLRTIAAGQIAQQYDTVMGQFGILCEPGSTNLALWNSDLTNAVWTKSNMSTAMTATGPDGVANSATTITATAGNATALQGITDVSQARITSVWIKRRTGTGNIDLTQNNGVSWTTVGVQSFWARFSLPSVTSANPGIGIRIVTNADAVDVALFQEEAGPVATSPILTSGSTVTRAADVVQALLSSMPSLNSAVTIYADFNAVDNVTSGFQLAQTFVDIGSGSGADFHDLSTNPGPNPVARTSTGAGTQFDFNNSDNQVFSARSQYQYGATTNDAAFVYQNHAIRTLSSGSMPTLTGGKASIGNFQGGGWFMLGLFYRLVVVPRKVSNADLPTWRYNF